jgi:predicted nucleic acid-binding protein
MSTGVAEAVDLVIDASIGVKWFVPEVQSEQALLLLEAGVRRHVPSLFFTEVAQTLWKKVHQRGELSEDEGREGVRSLLLMPLTVHPSQPLLDTAFEIATRTGRTVSDSIYLALADTLGCRLVTADLRLFNALQESLFATSLIVLGDIKSPFRN